MKIRDRLIVSLSDFSKHIDFPTFQFKKRQFVRDLNPKQCYYWTDKKKILFDVIKIWINIEDGIIPESEWTFYMEKGDNSLKIVDSQKEEKVQLAIQYDNKYFELLEKLTKKRLHQYMGILALNELIERAISLDEIEVVYDVVSNSETLIIKALIGTTLYCKGISSANTNEPYRIRKIEVIGEGKSSVEIYIDNIKHKSLKAGECVYAICKGAGFVKILPNEKNNEDYSLTLYNKPGEFSSILEVEDNTTNVIVTYENVTSFALDNAGAPVYTTADGKLHISPKNFTLSQQLKGFKQSHPNDPILAIDEKNGYYKFYSPQLIYG